MPFDKKPLTVQQMFDRLVERGLVVSDEAELISFLERVNYYRLAAYTHPFKRNLHQEDEAFEVGVSQRVILDHYEFDSGLRARVFKSIETLEVTARRHLAYGLSHAHGAFAHLKGDLFSDQREWSSTIEIVKKEYAKSHTQYASYFQEVHPELILPPIWASVELMSFGSVRRLFTNLRTRQDRQKVASNFGLDEKVLGSFLAHLEQVRNYCAHHERLWNTRFSRSFVLPANIKEPYSSKFVRDDPSPKTIYNTLVFLDYFESLNSIPTLLNDVEDLLKSSPSVNRKFMGYPSVPI